MSDDKDENKPPEDMGSRLIRFLDRYPFFVIHGGRGDLADLELKNEQARPADFGEEDDPDNDPESRMARILSKTWTPSDFKNARETGQTDILKAILKLTAACQNAARLFDLDSRKNLTLREPGSDLAENIRLVQKFGYSVVFAEGEIFVKEAEVPAGELFISEHGEHQMRFNGAAKDIPGGDAIFISIGMAEDWDLNL